MITFLYSPTYFSYLDALPIIKGRAKTFYSLLKAYDILSHSSLQILEPRIATAIEIEAFHSREYIQVLSNANKYDENQKHLLKEHGLVDDCAVFPDMWLYVLSVAGASLHAAQLISSLTSRIVLQWGGGWHHAKRDCASGYCYINDCILSILHLMSKFDRVLYIDWDLHHADGVQEAFYGSDSVFTLSFHHYSTGFFPGTGNLSDMGYGSGYQKCLNVPLKEGLSDNVFCAVFDQVFKKVLHNYSPNAIILQSGCDGLSSDPSKIFNLTTHSFCHCFSTILHTNLPLLVLGGGGYNISSTARCWTLLTLLAAQIYTIPRKIPDHDNILQYSPDFEIHTKSNGRKDENTKEYLYSLASHWKLFFQ